MIDSLCNVRETEANVNVNFDVQSEYYGESFVTQLFLIHKLGGFLLYTDTALCKSLELAFLHALLPKSQTLSSFKAIVSRKNRLSEGLSTFLFGHRWLFE